MRKSNWAEMKAMNARIRCTGDKTSRCNVGRPVDIERAMRIDDAPRMDRRHYLTPKEGARLYEQREEARAEAREGLYGRNVFAQGQVARPQKGKFRNRVWAEECGGTAAFVATIRSRSTYTHTACKVKAI